MSRTFKLANVPTFYVSPEPCSCPRSCFRGFGFAVAMRSGGFQGMEQAYGGVSDLVNGGVESGFVGFGRMVEAGDFPDELQGSGAHLFRRNRRIEIEKRFDVAAHRRLQSGQ